MSNMLAVLTDEQARSNEHTRNESCEMSDTKAFRSALQEKQAELRRFMDNGIKVEGSNIEMKSEDFTKAKQIMADIAEIKGLIDMENLANGGAPGQSVAMGFSAQGGTAPQVKSLGESFVGSDEFKSLQQSGRLTMDQPYEINRADITAGHGYGQKDLYTGALTDALNPRGFGSVQRDAAVLRPHLTNRVRDLFPVATTSANLIDYFRVLGFTGGKSGARPVAERDGTAFGLKPQTSLAFENAQAPVRTIAHWEAAHRNVLADEPQLRSIIDNELLYGLALAEDDQILNGDGQGENLLGILNTPGIQRYTGVSGDQMSDQLRKSATLSVLANYPGNGFVLHPFDWEKIELQKAKGDGQYMLTSNVAIGATTQVWRQPVVESPAMNEGTWLTGAFGIGAQLYDREQANVRIAEQHADFFIRNAVAILAEERIALACKRPESFVVGTFSE